MTDEGLRSLAAAVLRQAVEEAHGAPRPGKPTRVGLRTHALAFLRPQVAALQFWCDCLDWGPGPFCEAARRNGRVLLSQNRRREREEA